jgi:single-strand DNA-binding protein
MNNASLVGRAGRDAEARYLENGKMVANFTIAVNRRKRDAEPLWVKVEIWGKPAQVAADYVKKGGLIGVSGEIDLDVWTDRATGEERKQLKLVANDLRLLGSKSDNQGQHGAPPSRSQPQNQWGGGEPSDEDIPF